MRKDLLALIDDLKEADLDPKRWYRTPETGTQSPVPAPGKGKTRALWYAAGLVVFVVIAILLFPTLTEHFGPPAEPNPTTQIEETKEQETPVETSRPSVPENKPVTPKENKAPAQKAEPVATKTPPPEPAVFYTVKLVVNAGMNNPANWRVDGQPLQLIRRNLNVLEIQVRKKEDAHRFEWRKDNRICSEEILIREDGQEVIVGCY